ncbi:MAG TPA: c-type cytochrome [Longimicrobiales bacterium]
MSRLRHPLGQVAVIMVVAYIVFRFGIWLVPPLIGVASAPVPGSVVFQYMVTVFVGALIYVSDNEERWREFKRPILATMVEPSRRSVRLALLVLLPLLAGTLAFTRVRPTVAAPAALRSIHPAPPGQITFRGRTLVLAELRNPLRAAGSVDEAYARGRSVYMRNCMPCHGDALSGDGYFAHGFNPAPIDFTNSGTIPQLTESFVFWRIAKGGPGLPREGAPWNSAMPAWEDILTEEEIWSVIVFLYEQTGAQPRSWEEEEH